MRMVLVEQTQGKAPMGCLSDRDGDIIFAEAKEIGVMTNMEAETMAKGIGEPEI